MFKKNISRIMVLVLVMLLALPTGILAQDTELSAAAQRAAMLTEQYGLTSVQYAVMADGEIIQSGTSGIFSAAGDRQLTDETVYGIGSVSKMFTTAVLMKLADEGKVSLEGKVTAYLPQFTMADDRYRDITLRMLLNHSSGLMGGTLGNAFLWGESDPYAHDTLLDTLKTQRLKADPGAFSVYCNDGFTLAELVAEAVTGKSFTALIHEYITDPLDLNRTQTPQDEINWAELARTYGPLDPAQETPVEVINLIGTGGIYSTAVEMCSVATIFTGEAGLLSEEALAATFEPEYRKGQWLEAEENIIGYGLGWDSVDLYPFSRYGIQAVSKGGDTQMYHAALIVLPEYNMSAAVLSSGGVSTYLSAFASQLLLDTLLEKGHIDAILPDEAPAVQEPVQVIEQEVLELAGIYASGMTQYSLSFEEGHMKLYPYGQPEAVQSFYYAGNGTFAEESGIALLRLIEQKGKTYLTQETLLSLPGLGQMRVAEYVGQRLAEYTPDAETLEAWQARVGKAYVLVTQRPSSLMYSGAVPAAGIGFMDEAPGYLVGVKLTGPNETQAAIQVPISGGRDMTEWQFVSVNGMEYLSGGGSLYMDFTAIDFIYTGPRSKAVIQPSGHTVWYLIPPELDGKSISIEVPENGGFALYGADGIAYNHYAVTGQNTAVLQAGGFIAFMGTAGSVFDITIE